MSYGSPIYTTYRYAAATLSAAATVGRFIGPEGKRGRIVGAEVITTTATTVAACALQVGPAGGTATANLDMSIPVTAINLGHQATKAEIDAGATMAADTVHNVSSDGGCTAGAGDLVITVAWF